MAEIDLAGKVVLVTGIGSGLGRAMSLALAESGAAVLGCDINEAAARATADTSKANGVRGSILPHQCDVRIVEACDGAIATAKSKLGGLTGLVNCAGLGMPHLSPDYLTNPVHFWKADPQRWQELIEVNVRGPFLLARAAAPHFIAQKWGRIVNVTTSFNTMIRGGNMPYGQSKAALEAASNSWAEDLRGTGVSVNVLIPGGAADTAMIPQGSPYDRSKLIRPEVMQAPIRWLMSNASDGVTAMRFIGQLWNPAASWQEAMKAAGAPVAWPDLAQGASRSQPVPKGGFKGERPVSQK